MADEGSNPKVKSILRTAIITHLALAITNVVMVATNLWVPRYIDDDDISVAEINILADELEFSLPNSIHSELVGYYPNQSLFQNYSVGACGYEFYKNLISTNCVEKILPALRSTEIYLDGQIKKISKELDIYKEISAHGAKYLTEPTDSKSTLDVNQLGLVVISDAFVAEEKQDKYLSYMSGVFIKDREDNLKTHQAAIKQLRKTLKQLIDDSANGPRYSGKVVFSVILHNKGYADGLITPSALIELGGQEIPVIAAGSISENSGDLSFQVEYQIVEKNSFRKVNFVTDYENMSANEIDILKNSLASKTQPDYRFVINRPGGEVDHKSNLKSELISLSSSPVYSGQ